MKLYMHTINDKPAKFSKRDGQIIFLSNGMKDIFCNSLAQIRKQQDITISNRISWGIDPGTSRYGYRMFHLTDSKVQESK